MHDKVSVDYASDQKALCFKASEGPVAFGRFFIYMALRGKSLER